LIIANGRRDSARFSNSPKLNTLDFLYGPPTDLQVAN
jgi:hypothetical protein